VIFENFKPKFLQFFFDLNNLNRREVLVFLSFVVGIIWMFFLTHKMVARDKCEINFIVAHITINTTYCIIMDETKKFISHNCPL
jgi:hypothetical protein